MQELLHMILELLQQGIAAIFRFFDVIYTWAFEQIMRLTEVPFGSWPWWKQVVFVLTVIGVVGLLFRAGRELWGAGERILEAFVVLLQAVVRVLPWVLLAGIVAAISLWILNHWTF